MKRRLVPWLVLLLATAYAQRPLDMAGIVVAEDPLPETARVGVHLLDGDGAWTLEIATAVTVVGSFQVEAGEVPGNLLRPFRSGAVLLPGLQNEYRVEPDDASYVQGTLSLYLDADGSGTWTRAEVRDPYYLALAQLEDPIGFFTIVYVDRPTTLRGSGIDLVLDTGWNVITVRFPEGQGATYQVVGSVADVLIDVIDLIPR